MKPVRSHTFGGKRYRIRWSKMRSAAGMCESPHDPEKTIWIDPRLDGIEMLDTLIHESTHALQWTLDEAAVEQFAHDIARFLWRLGYRRT